MNRLIKTLSVFSNKGRLLPPKLQVSYQALVQMQTLPLEDHVETTHEVGLKSSLTSIVDPESKVLHLLLMIMPLLCK